MISMVIKFEIHKLMIYTGLLLCALSIFSIPLNDTDDVLTEISKTSATLIIDAGHGGDDGGTVGVDGVKESKINLEIAQRLHLLAKLCGISTVMTRDSQEIDYLQEAHSIAERKLFDQKSRLSLILDYPHGILYSIHQNAYPNENVSGIQVFYGHDDKSRNLGVLLQSSFNVTLGIQSRRLAAEISDNIYLMKHCNCTGILVECGFLSNPEECKLLQKDSYQKKLSTVMLGAFMEYTNLQG